MQVVITGGICSGKSTASKIFEKYGFYIIDADKIAHKMLDENISAIKEIFGDEYVKSGKVDRKKIAKVVFSDKRKKEELEALLHPLIKEEIGKEIKRAEKEGKRYLLDIPLFFETGNYKADKVILIYVDRKTQLLRLQKRDGLSCDEAQKRIKSQIDIEKKREMSDIVIDNTKSIRDLEDEIKKAIDADFKI
jgi:dephospho-CoA kinase